MQTIKLKYKASDEDKQFILSVQKQYTNCLHLYFNRLSEGYSETECKHLEYNNLDLLDAWFRQSCVKETNMIKAQLEERNQTKIIFGSKANYFKRLKGKISNEDYKTLRIRPLYSIGTASNKSIAGNQKFHLENDLSLTFKFNRQKHLKLELLGIGNRSKLLKDLYLRQETRKFSLTYKLDQNFVYISFDEKELYKDKFQFAQIKNRVLSIDLNPNYIGWSIVDWKSDEEFEVIKSGVYNLNALNKLDTNKKHHELLEISKNLVDKTLYYKCQLFGVEGLSIKSSDKHKGKAFNKLCNNDWVRNLVVNNLRKRCNIFNIKFLEVRPEYSSFVGNYLFRHIEPKMPDMCLASLEIGRRAYQFNSQYVEKTKYIKKNIIFPQTNEFKTFKSKSLEEFNLNGFNSLKEIYYFLKDSKIKYRVPLDKDLEFFRCFSRQSQIWYYNFV